MKSGVNRAAAKTSGEAFANIQAAKVVEFTSIPWYRPIKKAKALNDLLIWQGNCLNRQQHVIAQLQNKTGV